MWKPCIHVSTHVAARRRKFGFNSEGTKGLILEVHVDSPSKDGEEGKGEREEERG